MLDLYLANDEEELEGCEFEDDFSLETIRLILGISEGGRQRRASLAVCKGTLTLRSFR